MPLTWAELLDRASPRRSARRGPAERARSPRVGVDSRSAVPGRCTWPFAAPRRTATASCRDAVSRGAAAVVVETRQQAGVPEIVVRDSHRAALVLGSAWYRASGARLTLIGVTGTNGKTTTTGLIRHLFNARNVGSIGTLGAFDGEGEPVASTAGSLTTPGPIDLQATLAAMVERGVTQSPWRRRPTAWTSADSTD